MANTYTQIYLHVVFAVNHRNALLPAVIHPKVHAYMSGILKGLGHVPIAIGGTEDHVHCLFGYNINKTIPETVRDLKSASTNYINASHFIPFKFEWQRGYACFSYSRSQIDAVAQYINHQYEHHKNTTFDDEIKRFLELFEIDYEMRYIPHSPQE